MRALFCKGSNSWTKREGELKVHNKHYISPPASPSKPMPGRHESECVFHDWWEINAEGTQRRTKPTDATSIPFPAIVTFQGAQHANRLKSGSCTGLPWHVRI